MENAVLCKNLVKEYRSHNGKINRVLDIDTIKIKRGSFFGILGSNGAGKSTLINIVTSLIRATSGSVEIFGKNIEDNPEFAKMKIGTAVQDVKLDPFPYIWEALEFQAGYYGIPKNQRKTDEILHNLGLYAERNKKARMLSGGMQRRLVIAKALVHNPDIIILDEPTAGVDIELRNNLWQFINNLKSQGKTIIITTHYLEEAQELCDEIAFIKGGKIILQDTKHNVLSLLDKKSAIIKTTSDFDLEKINIDGTNIIKHPLGLKVNYIPSQINTFTLLEKLKEYNIEINDLTIKDSNLDEIFSYIINK